MAKKSFPEIVQSLRKQIIYAKTTARTLGFELSRQVEEEEGYLFENAREFAQFLLRIIEGLELSLELDYERELLNILRRDPASIDTMKDDVKRIHQRTIEALQISAELTDMLKYVNGAKSIENPWGVIAEVDRLCRNLNNRARMIPYPRWEHNYRYYAISYKLWRISDFANFQDSRINAALTHLLTDSPYYFSLQFPPASKPNILQMGMWGHELGHFIDNIEGMSEFNVEMLPRYQITYVSEQRVNEIVRNTVPSDIMRKLTGKARFTDEAKIFEVLQNINERMGELIRGWAKEVFADLYSVHLFGPAAIFSLVEFARPLALGKTRNLDETYPPFDVRLDLVLQEYESWLTSDPETSKLVKDSTEESLRVLTVEIESLRNFDSELQDFLVNDEKFSSDEFEDFFEILHPYMNEILKNVVNDFRQEIAILKKDNPECYLKPEDLIRIAKSIKDLELGVPPSLISDTLGALDIGGRMRILPLIINAGWIYWLKVQHHMSEKDRVLSEEATLYEEFERINHILLKAMEENVAIQWFSENSRFTESDPTERTKANRLVAESMEKNFTTANPFAGVLGKNDLLAKLSTGEFLVRPLISPATQIHEASIDIRLGNEFTIMKRSAVTKQDPVQIYKDPNYIDHQIKHFVPFGKPFVLHPWQFITTSSLEFLKIPELCVGWIANRNSWTKLGLVYVGAQDLSPGFRGQIVLELTNFGNAPILLYPGSRICSLYLIPVNQKLIARED